MGPYHYKKVGSTNTKCLGRRPHFLNPVFSRILNAKTEEKGVRSLSSLYLRLDRQTSSQIVSFRASFVTVKIYIIKQAS